MPEDSQMGDLSARVRRLEAEMSRVISAFPKNDLDLPDYDGHRKSHNALRKSEEVFESYKVKTTEKVISLIVVFLLGLVGSGLLQQVKTFLP